MEIESIMFVIAANQAFHKNSTHRPSGEILGSVADLSTQLGLTKLSVYHEVLPPGHRSSPGHKHSEKEEFVFVIHGTAKVWTEQGVSEIKVGDVAGFALGMAHMVYNNSDEDVHLLVVSTAQQIGDKITFVPDDSISAILRTNS